MNPLILSDEQYKTIFERVTRLSLDYLTSIGERPSFPRITGSETQTLLAKQLPEHGTGESAFDDLAEVIAGREAAD